MISHMQRGLWAVTMIAFVLSSAVASAQDAYRDKTLTFIVGYSPGGTYEQ